jgi:hypothetical protein
MLALDDAASAPVKSRGDHAAARAELYRLRAIDCAAKTQRDPIATPLSCTTKTRR